MTEPVGVVVEDDIVTGRLVVNGPLWIAIVTVDVSVGTTLEGFLTDDCRCAAQNVGRRCREDGCLDIVVNHGVPPVVGNDIDVEYSFSVQATGVEVINAFDCWVVQVERLDVADDLVIHTLLVPCMVAESCGDSVNRIVEEVG